MTEAELLDAIYAAPDDDAPRLVYADWLQERGDPRGEFIALQLAGNGPGARESALRAAHAPAWIGPLAPSVQDVTFARGFIDTVEILFGRDGHDPRVLTEDRRWSLLRGLSVADLILDGHDDRTIFTPLTALLHDPRSLPRLRRLELTVGRLGRLPQGYRWLWPAPLMARVETLVLYLWREEPPSPSLWRRVEALPLALRRVRIEGHERGLDLVRDGIDTLAPISPARAP